MSGWIKYYWCKWGYYSICVGLDVMKYDVFEIKKKCFDGNDIDAVAFI